METPGSQLRMAIADRLKSVTDPVPLVVLAKEIDCNEQQIVDYLTDAENGVSLALCDVKFSERKFLVVFSQHEGEAHSHEPRASSLSFRSPHVKVSRKRVALATHVPNAGTNTKRPCLTDLKTKLRQKQIQLEEKRRKKSLADKSANPEEVKKLAEKCEKWMEVCRSALRKTKDHAFRISSTEAPSLGVILEKLQIPPELLQYNPDTDDFD